MKRFTISVVALGLLIAPNSSTCPRACALSLRAEHAHNRGRQCHSVLTPLIRSKDIVEFDFTACASGINRHRQPAPTLIVGEHADDVRPLGASIGSADRRQPDQQQDDRSEDGVAHVFPF